MITILDFGISNIGGVINALNFLNIKNKIVSTTKELKLAKKIIIPGSGNFGEGMRLLKKSGFDDVLNNLVLIRKVPILGICLGYHLMLKSSEENRNTEGLGWINGKAIKFIPKKILPVPHVGWNKIQFLKSSLAKNIPSNAMYYFDHSYYPKIFEKNFFNSKTNYGVNFTSIYEKENIFGCQPHPEKSQKYGLFMLENFCKQ